MVVCSGEQFGEWACDGVRNVRAAATPGQEQSAEIVEPLSPADDILPPLGV